MRYITSFLGSYFFVTLLALVLGVLLPDILGVFEPYSAFLLGGIFFFSSLLIKLGDVKKYFLDLGMISTVVILMLIIFPIVIYFLTLWIYPPLALPFLLLASMPSGMTAPLLTEVAGGKQSLALVLTVSTSLLAPLSVPILIKLLAGTSVVVSFWGMFSSLALVIFTPFILAQITKKFIPKVEFFAKPISKPVSIVLLALLVGGIVAHQSDAILRELSVEKVLIYIGALFVVFIVLQILGYFAVFWRSFKERIAVSVCLTYMNFTLAIYLADTFFPDPSVIIRVILSIIPWVILLTPFKMSVKRLG